MRRMAFFILLLFTGHSFAQETGNDSYTIQRLILFNESGQILLQKHANGWMTPALRHNKPLTTIESLSELAADFGLQMSTPKLRGIFMYFHSDDKKPSFRQHYSAHLVAGELKTPEGLLDAKWFDPKAAISHMTDKDAKLIPTIGETTEQILNYPDIIWGGSYMLIKNKGKKSTPVVKENYYPIGKVN